VIECKCVSMRCMCASRHVAAVGNHCAEETHQIVLQNYKIK
jgi:hypothetical protein